MLKQQVYLILCLFTAVTTAPNPNLDGAINGNCKDECITLESLLCEMIDRDRLAQFPTPEYESLQYSSYNRNSVPPPGSPGWFADSDGTQCIRTEFINGQKEWVIMEHDGPGCITTLWTPFFYYGYRNRVGPHIKVYLDGSDTPVIDETFIELESGDKTAIFFPGVGANYRISNATNGVIPSTPGAAMQQVNTTQNIAAVQLDDWLDSGSGKRIYILSADIQTMTVLVYK